MKTLSSFGFPKSLSHKKKKTKASQLDSHNVTFHSVSIRVNEYIRFLSTDRMRDFLFYM